MSYARRSLLSWTPSWNGHPHCCLLSLYAGSAVHRLGISATNYVTQRPLTHKCSSEHGDATNASSTSNHDAAAPPITWSVYSNFPEQFVSRTASNEKTNKLGF